MYDAETFRWIVSGLAGLLVSIGLWFLKRIMDEARDTRLMLYAFVNAVSLLLVEMHPEKGPMIMEKLGTAAGFRVSVGRRRETVPWNDGLEK